MACSGGKVAPTPLKKNPKKICSENLAPFSFYNLLEIITIIHTLLYIIIISFIYFSKILHICYL